MCGYGGVRGFGDGIGSGPIRPRKPRNPKRTKPILTRPKPKSLGSIPEGKFKPKSPSFPFKPQVRPKHIPKRTFDAMPKSAQEATINSIVKKINFKDLTPRQQDQFENRPRNPSRNPIIPNFDLGGNDFREFKNNLFGTNIPNFAVERVQKEIKRKKREQFENDTFGFDFF